MKFVAISDTHNKHNQVDLPEGDVLLHAGDFTGRGRSSEIKNFAKWLDRQTFEHKIIIPGNHDLKFEHNWDKAVSYLPDDVIILNQSWTKVGDIKIWGEPRQPEFGSGWAFNVPRDYMATECWDKVPDDIDILLTHGPPLGCCDQAEDMHYMGWGPPKMKNVGCSKQRAMMKDHPNLKVVVCGHIHESYGRAGYAGIDVYNAAICNLAYKPVNKPWVFEL